MVTVRSQQKRHNASMQSVNVATVAAASCRQGFARWEELKGKKEGGEDVMKIMSLVLLVRLTQFPSVIQLLTLFPEQPDTSQLH